MPASLDWSASSSAAARPSPSCGASVLDAAPRAGAAWASSASRKPNPNSALSSNSEFDHAGPAAVAVGRVRRRRQVAAVDRRAAGRVGDQQPVAEELREQLEVRRLAAAGAGARVFEQRLEELRALVIELRHRGRDRARAGRGRSRSCRARRSRSGACGCMSIALCLGLVRSLAGQTLTHRLQPVQSSGAT